MKIQQAAALAALFAAMFAVQPVLAEESFPIYRFWKGMYSATGREMGLVLNTGAYVRGKALAVREDGIELDVRKSSDATAYPRKRLTIPRGDIDELELYERIERRTSEDAREIAAAGRTAAIGIGGTWGAQRSGVAGTVIGGVLGNLAGVLGSVAIRRLGSETREEVIRIRILPDDGKLAGIPPEIQHSGEELLRERQATERVPMQLTQ